MDKVKQNIIQQQQLDKFNIEKSVVGTEACYINQDIQKGMSQEEIIEKARSGVYKLTAENKKAGRVGQRYGESKKEDDLYMQRQREKLKSINENTSTRDVRHILFDFHNQDQKIKVTGVRGSYNTTISNQRHELFKESMQDEPAGIKKIEIIEDSKEPTDKKDTMKATHITYENKNNRQIAQMVMTALKNLTGNDQGTIANPVNESSIIVDGRTIIQTIKEDGYIRFNDGYMVVECDDYCLYVDYTSKAISEWNLPEYKYRSNIN